MIKVVYITSPSFFDADLSYILKLQEIVDLNILIDLPAYGLNSTALAIEKQPLKSGIFHIDEINDFQQYKNFLGDQCYIINRPVAKRLSLETFMLNFKLKQFLNNIKPDIIHLNNPIPQYGRSVLKFKAPKVLTIHDPIPHIGENPKNLYLRKWNMKYINNFIILNQYQRESFIRKYDLKESQVHNTFLSSFMYYEQFKTQIINNSDELNLLFFGRITPYKGLEYLVQAFEIVRKSHPNLTLTIAGKGPIPSSINVQNGLTIINKFIDSKELAKLINQSHLVICPYIEGTQSGVIMTSFAFDKPVLATKVGGFHEMIEDGVTGYLIDPKSVKSITDKLLDILRNPNELIHISSNIKKMNASPGSRSWHESAKKTVDVYQKILRNE